MASAQCPKPTTTIEVCQPKGQHSSFGQKNSEMTGKAFKGHHDGRYGNGQNQLQCYSQQTLVESHDQNNSKSETHSYGQTQTKQENRHEVTKTQIKVTVVEAEITQTYENHDSYPYGTTTCFGSHAVKNGEPNKDRNLFQRLKNHIPHHKNDGNSSKSDSDDEKCPKSKAGVEKCPKSKPSNEKCLKSKAGDKNCPKSKVSDEKCPKTKVSDEKCPKSKVSDEKCPKSKPSEKCPKSNRCV
ncbi:PREDICTED: uncharacterized protein LOC109333317 isoform X7 [Lupinus angustifolius]|uniref:uncharacterized protein LOC109333317 isoform X7 n=1 Tax=Lupinus angustifolius TaxID=3871 RepID=UPI00092FCA7C|nr:PREDICTED: uncharacterized protein LOC109333317 isoform X7 [Lupinus angustifolius]